MNCTPEVGYQSNSWGVFYGDSFKCLREFPEDANQDAGYKLDKEKSGWTQAEAATRCGVTQPRMNDLLRGHVSRFSLDALVNIATATGRRAHMELQAA